MSLTNGTSSDVVEGILGFMGNLGKSFVSIFGWIWNLLKGPFQFLINAAVIVGCIALLCILLYLISKYCFCKKAILKMRRKIVKFSLPRNKEQDIEEIVLGSRGLKNRTSMRSLSKNIFMHKASHDSIKDRNPENSYISNDKTDPEI